MATTETRAAFARRHGVNRSTVGRWETKGSLVLTVDGLVSVEASEQLLGARAETYRGGKAKGPSAHKAPATVASNLDAPAAQDSLALAHAGLAEVIRAIGPYAARMAVEFGAPLEVAYGLDQAVAVEADCIAARFLAQHGYPDTANGYGTLESLCVDFVEADWAALAKAAGARLDLDALDAWFTGTPYWRSPAEASA
ncbi:hypothetical protein [Methylobacterium longum]|uniref:Uncharacterized protein n=1 Tax=Methylobacterium longum TaxID=767694 RepID=A0ABT8AQI3_9HYPH|nr:hypothetical protein [Methylobacterium longum]MDN3572089.1 hypothetical protein [Methylobacterium longum]GJE11071.1 hypothetical protein FOHLNKBM_2109 [Methylobacterium longum]